MIYTSYFAKLKQLPEDVIPISICGKAPQWYTGLQYKKLAPKYDFFIKWKENHDNEYYIKCFNERVLGNLNIIKVITELQTLIPYEIKCNMESTVYNNSKYNIALICYEKPTDFCHRHLVAEWLRNNGIKCEEYKFSEQEKKND